MWALQRLVNGVNGVRKKERKKERKGPIDEMDDSGKPGSLANNHAVCYNLNKKKTARARRLGIQWY